jgi:hypothetical protein
MLIMLGLERKRSVVGGKVERVVTVGECSSRN